MSSTIINTDAPPASVKPVKPPKKLLSPEQLQKQQRKIQKDQRRKQFHDISVQGTNDYSIVSKRSVEKLYNHNASTSPHYFHHFVKKHARRSPAINRGYWTRMEAIKRLSYQIIQNAVAKGQKCCVVNLGAGYDPLAFSYLDPNNKELDAKGLVQFVDVDYPDLNKIKIDMIRQSEELKQIIGEEERDATTFQGVDLRTKNYTVLSCDLKNINLFTSQLEYLHLDDPAIVKIYIAEVSIAYMLPKHADPVIRATSQFANSHFLCLEQILPAGPHQAFARTMLSHFAKLNSPLNCVETYHSLDLQKQRFLDQGYGAVSEAMDLNNFWKNLDLETKQRIAGVEAFDEWEEFVVFGQHYLILHASNVDFPLFDKPITSTEQVEEAVSSTTDDGFKFSIQQTAEERKFHASTVLSNKTIITHGGASISRLDSILSTTTAAAASPITIASSSEGSSQPCARLSHTLTSLGDTDSNQTVFLCGGRTAPNKPLSDTWKLTSKSSDSSSSSSSSRLWTWEQSIPLPEPRFRHSTFLDSHGEIYVFGGSSDGNSQASSPFIKLNRLTNQWEDVPVVISTDLVLEPLKSLHSAAVCLRGDNGVIIGGMDMTTFQTSSTLYAFQITDRGIVIKSAWDHPLFNRFGARAEYIGDNDEVVLIGGVSELMCHNQSNSIIKINGASNEKKKDIQLVTIPQECWAKVPLFVGFQFVKLGNDKLVCLNGGAVCYSFGSVWNDYLIIDLDDNNDTAVEELGFKLAAVEVVS